LGGTVALSFLFDNYYSTGLTRLKSFVSQIIGKLCNYFFNYIECSMHVPQNLMRRRILKSFRFYGELRACLDVFKIPKVYKILRHIESLDACIKH